METTQTRRDFCKLIGMAATGLAFSSPSMAWASASERKFTLSLDPGAIGVKADPQTLLSYAITYGFEAITPLTAELMALKDKPLKQLMQQMRDANITWGIANLPFNFRKDLDTHRAGMKDLEKTCKFLQQIGVTRMGTWIMPHHPERTYLENFKWHTDRLGEITRVTAAHGIRFGLEYVGPTTLRNAGQYPFLHTLKETRELLAAIGNPMNGVIMDTFHWFTAKETLTDLQSLTAQEVVACDLNDAVAGRTAEEQLDNQRELPMASGVIDPKPMLETLVRIGFDGPVRAEPFNQALREMPAAEALKATVDAMRKALAIVGG
jgi:sugar phosphate isomerase/epimerase